MILEADTYFAAFFPFDFAPAFDSLTAFTITTRTLNKFIHT